MENPFAKKSATENGSGATPAVANGGQSNPPGAASIPVSAVESVPKYGGNRGGKPRADKLVPGSPEAKLADREKERQRKADYRARVAVQNPPVIPAALPEDKSVSDQGTAQSGPVALSVDGSFVPWDEQTIRPALEEIIPIWEEQRKNKRQRKAAAARLSAGLIKQIGQTGWDPKAKSAVARGGAQTLAKWMNKFGLSAEYAPELTLATGLVSLWRADSRLEAQLDEIIAQNKARDAATANKP